MPSSVSGHGISNLRAVFSGMDATPWTIHLIHHSHVDLGYTEAQAEVRRKHGDYIAQALDLCQATDDRPDPERFRWTCEVFWTVEAFLERHPKREAELVQRCREGRIEITALWSNGTDLTDLALWEASLDRAGHWASRHGLQLRSAMNSDVNGWAWGLPALLNRRGVRWLDVGINETRALGVRPRPWPFRWLAPDGNEVLVWHGENYLAGNTMLEDPQRLRSRLAELAAQGWPCRHMALRVHGANHDNAPPGGWLPDAVAAWNRSNSDMHLRLGTPTTWFSALESSWGRPFDQHQAAWPDWWSDGLGSAAAESALVRQAQTDFTIIAGCGGLDRVADGQARLAKAQEQALLFCEHTWGAWNSTDEPGAAECRAQWNVKAGHAYAASTQASGLRDAALRAIAPTPAAPGPWIHVHNSSPTPLGGVVEVLVQDAILDGRQGPQVLSETRTGSGPACHLVDAAGRAVPVERSPAIATSARWQAQRIRFIAHQVPAQGWISYRLMPGAGPDATTASAGADSISCGDWTLTVDAGRGGVSSLRRAGRELVDASGPLLWQHVHETVHDLRGRSAVAGWDGIHRDAGLVHRALPWRIDDTRCSALGASMLISMAEPDIRLRLDLPAGLDRCDVTVEARLSGSAVEGLYCAVPIAAESPCVHLQVPGAVFRPGLDQIPGSAADWHAVQDYAAVVGSDGSAILATPDLPLIQVGGINTGQWRESIDPRTGLLQSWICNNHWFTNFPAEANQRLRYRYSLAWQPGAFDPVAASSFATGIRRGLVGVVV